MAPEGGRGRADAAAEVIRTGKLTALRAAGFGVIELESFSGAPAPLLKVGTMKRAMDLEVEQVLLGRVDGSLLAPAAEGLHDGAAEGREIARRELYVGMTRARDELWVGQPGSLTPRVDPLS